MGVALHIRVGIAVCVFVHGFCPNRSHCTVSDWGSLLQGFVFESNTAIGDVAEMSSRFQAAAQRMVDIILWHTPGGCLQMVCNCHAATHHGVCLAWIEVIVHGVK